MKKINIIIKEEDNKKLDVVKQSSLTQDPKDRPKSEP